MNSDYLEVDKLIQELADYKNDCADMAAEKLLRKCSTSWDAHKYLQDRVHDSWLPIAPDNRCDKLSKRYRCS
jgi:hypothetical protein